MCRYQIRITFSFPLLFHLRQVPLHHMTVRAFALSRHRPFKIIFCTWEKKDRQRQRERKERAADLRNCSSLFSVCLCGNFSTLLPFQSETQGAAVSTKVLLKRLFSCLSHVNQNEAFMWRQWHPFIRMRLCIYLVYYCCKLHCDTDHTYSRVILYMSTVLPFNNQIKLL